MVLLQADKNWILPFFAKLTDAWDQIYMCEKTINETTLHQIKALLQILYIIFIKTVILYFLISEYFINWIINRNYKNIMSNVISIFPVLHSDSG